MRAAPDLEQHDVDAERRPLRRSIAWLVAALMVLWLLGGVLVGLLLVSVRAPLEDARAAVRDAQAALLRGDLEGAGASLREANGRFARGAEATRGILGVSASVVPVLGRNVDAARAIADAGVRLTDAGLELVGAIEALPGGVDALVPRGGRLPLETLASLAEPASAAAERARAAQSAIEASPDTLLLPPVARARWDASVEIREAAGSLQTSAGLIRGFPSFAGADETRRYLVLAENPAELRGTGGLWGAYSILTFDDGLLRFSPFRPIQGLPEDFDVDSVPDPNPDYRREYGQYRAPANWRNQNITPDFPSAARAALGSWEALKGQTLDGVMAVDPFALREVLRITGPVDVPELGERINASNVVDVATNDTYTRFDDPAGRKEGIGDAAEAALTRFLHMRGRGLDRLQALAKATEGGHLNLYVTEPTFQEALAATDVGGALDAPPGDLLLVLVSNAAENKIDYFVTRTVEYEVRLGGQEEAFSFTTVTLRNDAPTRGEPRIVIGPNVQRVVVDGEFVSVSAGDEVHLTSVWCPADCPLVLAERDEQEIGLRPGSELGRGFWYDYALTPSGRSSELHVVTRRDGVWEGDPSSGTYRLTILPQTTIRPTDYSVTITPPDGTRVTWATDEVTIEPDGTAKWRGTVVSPLTLEVRFQAPMPLRWWRNLNTWLG
jgi:hypothetical protein